MYKIYGIGKFYRHECGTRFIEETESLEKAYTRILELTCSDDGVYYVVAENDDHALEKRRQVMYAVNTHEICPDIPLFRVYAKNSVSEEKKDIMSFDNYFMAFSYARSFSKRLKEWIFSVSLERFEEDTIEDILLNGIEIKGGF